jgi:hypothetical protein
MEHTESLAAQAPGAGSRRRLPAHGPARAPGPVLYRPISWDLINEFTQAGDLDLREWAPRQPAPPPEFRNIGRYMGHVQLHPSMAISGRFLSHAPGVPGAAGGTATRSTGSLSGVSPSRSRAGEMAPVAGTAHSLCYARMSCGAPSQPPYHLRIAVPEEPSSISRNTPRHEQAKDGTA